MVSWNDAKKSYKGSLKKRSETAYETFNSPNHTFTPKFRSIKRSTLMAKKSKEK